MTFYKEGLLHYHKVLWYCPLPWDQVSGQRGTYLVERPQDGGMCL